MGRGDIKTKKGKIARGSFGNSRPRKVEASAPVAASAKASPKEPKETKPKKTKKAEG